MADDFPPVIDGTLGSCDQLFALLLAYLRGLNLKEAARVLFVADGAAWIWRRIPGLVKSLGLKDDQVQQLIDSRKTQAQKTWLNDFIAHGLTHRLRDYSKSRTHHMPIGSGAIESAVRRVINMRVKSNAVYWLRDNAESIIRLRAWIKAGRAEELFHQITYITPTLAL